MEKTMNADVIKNGVNAYKNHRSKLEKTMKIRLKARIRTMMGMSPITRGGGFQKRLDHICDESWKVSWARLYDYTFSENNLSEWLLRNSLDLFIVSADQKEREMVFQLMNGLYLNTLTNFAKGIIHRYYDDKMALYQKSREIAEKTIYKVLLNLDTYNPYKAGFLTWMFNIARNTALTPGKKADESTDYILDREESDDEAMEQDKSDYLKSKEAGPDELYAKAEMGKTVLEILFKASGYPWQILCVGFMKIDYKPGDIVEKFSESTLNEMFRAFKDEFSSSSFRSEADINSLFDPLEAALQMPLSEIILSRDSRTKKALEENLDKACGEVKLCAFFGNSPNKNISDWNARSLTRLRKELKERNLI